MCDRIQKHANLQISLFFSIVNLCVNSAAYDVELKDNEWPAENFVVTGNLKATFDKIEAGHNVTHTYTVTPKIVGSVNTESAIVSFKTNPEEETKYYVKSSVLPQLTIMTQAQFDKRNDTHLDDWVIFTLLAFIPVGLPGLVYLYSKNQIDQLASQGAKKKQ